MTREESPLPKLNAAIQYATEQTVYDTRGRI